MYATNHLPKQDVKNSPTGCCPKFEPKEWDGQTFYFEDKLFMNVRTRSFLHIPLNLGKGLAGAMTDIEAADASVEDEYLILTDSSSAWKDEHYIAVAKDVPGAKMVRLSGDYLAKVFEGPYKNAGRWHKQLVKYAEEKSGNPSKFYFFYTTCPKCAKKYGKNYVVGFAKVG